MLKIFAQDADLARRNVVIILVAGPNVCEVRIGKQVGEHREDPVAYRRPEETQEALGTRVLTSTSVYGRYQQKPPNETRITASW